MIGMMTATPITPMAADLRPFFDLLALIADPVGTGDRVKALERAAADAQGALAEANAALADLATNKAAQAAALERASDEHAARLEAEQSAFNARCAQRVAELDKRDTDLRRLETRMKADAEAAATARADLERRLSIVQQAAA